ncbi:hypothetical protein HPP92_012814 [Vanilla planifolia]|uniref:Uncharacterized protein n=1 Tax=Vanilla planifolia TaxID=51239 RepID=A0A835QXS6_VANPL|nr:hypothetical protein HPP92_012814 [Vanilla planifolia]
MWAEARIRGAWQAQIWKRWASSGVFSSLLLAAQWNRTCLRERAMMGTVSPVLVRMLANCQADRQLSVARMLIGVLDVRAVILQLLCRWRMDSVSRSRWRCWGETGFVMMGCLRCIAVLVSVFMRRGLLRCARLGGGRGGRLETYPEPSDHQDGARIAR